MPVLNPFLPYVSQPERIARARRFKLARDLHRLDIKGSAASHAPGSKPLDLPTFRLEQEAKQKGQSAEPYLRSLGSGHNTRDFMTYEIDRLASEKFGAKSTAGRFLEIRKLYPDMTTSLAYGLATKGFQASDPITSKMAKVNQDYQRRKRKSYEEDNSFIGQLRHSRDDVRSAVGSSVKRTSQVVAGVGQSIPEGLDAAARLFAKYPSPGMSGTLIATPVGQEVAGPDVTRAKLKANGNDLKKDLANLPEQFSIGQWAMGQDPGTGFFIGGEAQQAQAKAAGEVYKVNGHAGTVGRVLFESLAPENNPLPGGEALFNLASGATDFAKQWYSAAKLDPTNKLASAGQKAVTNTAKLASPAELRAILTTGDADLLDNAMGGFHRLSTERGKHFIEGLHDVAGTSPSRAWVASNEKLDPGLLTDIHRKVQAGGTQDDVRGMITEYGAMHSGFLGTDTDYIPKYTSAFIGAKTPVPGFLHSPRQTLQRSRLFINKPGAYTDLSTDLESNLKNFRNELKTLKVPEDEMYQTLDKFMMARPEDRASLIWDARKSFTQHYVDNFKQAMTSDKKFMAKHGEDFVNEELDRISDLAASVFVNPGKDSDLTAYLRGNGPFDNAHLLQDFEINADSIPSIDYHNAKMLVNNVVKGMTTKAGRKAALDLAIKSREVAGGVMDAQRFFFRNKVLLRGALGVRIIGEGQFRIAAHGLTSIVSNPVELMQIMAGDYNTWSGRAARKLLGHSGKVPKFSQTVLGGEISRLADDPAIAKDLEWYLGSLRMNHMDNYSSIASRYDGPIDYVQRQGIPGAKAETEHIDDLAQDIARTRTSAVASHSLREGKESTVRFLESDKDGQELWASLQRNDKKIATMDVSDYVDFVDKTARELAGNDPDLIRYIATGADEVGNHVIDSDLRKLVEKKLVVRTKSEYGNDHLTWASNVPKLWVGVHDQGRNINNNELMDFLRKTSNGLMNLVYKRPDDVLTIGPAARQEYWNYVIDHVSELSPKAYKELKPIAEEQLPARLFKRFEDGEELVRGRAKKAIGMERDEVHELAGRYARNRVNDLLWTNPVGTQFGDVTRGIFPFADAFAEVVGAWAKILKKNPLTVPLRGHQIVRMVQSQLSYDPRTGKHIFIQPFSPIITQAIGGIPNGFTGTFENLNMIGQSPMPGMYPWANNMAFDLMEPYKAFDDIRRTLIFSRKEGNTFQETVGLPRWAETLWSAVPGAVKQDAQTKFIGGNSPWASKFVENYSLVNSAVMSELYSSGKYGTSEAQYNRMVKDAGDITRKLLVTKSIADFWAPTAPRIPDEVWVKEKDGGRELAMRAAVANDFHENYVKKYGEDAMAHFVEDYGSGAIVALFSSSKPTNLNRPGVDVQRTDIYPSQKLYDFERKHKDLYKKYPGFWHLFAGIGSEWATEEQGRLLKRGEIEQISPEYRIQQANRTLGNIVYKNWLEKMTGYAEDAIDGGASKTAVMSQLADMKKSKRAELAKKFYGFNEVSTVDFRARNDYYVKQIKKALFDKKDPVLLKTDAGRGAKEFFSLFDKADQAWANLRDSGEVEAKSWRTGQTDVALKFQSIMANEAGKIIQKHPDFWPMYNEIFQYYISTSVDTAQDKPEE